MSSPDFTLRGAEPEDVRKVWEINNDPSVRAQAVETTEIPWDEHVEWYERVLGDVSCVLWLVEVGGEVCGTVRFDLRESLSEAVITVAVSPSMRGQGVGRRAIRRASERILKRADVRHVLAEIRPDNAPSICAFEAAGFRPCGEQTRDGVRLRIFQFPPEAPSA